MVLEEVILKVPKRVTKIDLESSSDEGTLEDLIIRIKELFNNNDMNYLSETEIIEKGDIALVIVMGKKSFSYNVVEILNFGSNTEVKYLRRILQTNKFITAGFLRLFM